MATISVVRSAAGNTAAAAPATTDANLGAASTTGNLLVLIVSCNATVNTPSGWTLDRSQVNSNAHYVFSKYSAGEQTVTVTPTSSAGMSWWIAELSNPIASSPLAATTSTGSSTAATTRSTGTTSSTSGATGGIAIAAFGDSIAGGGSTTWSGYTNSFVETADTITTSGSTNVGLAVATVAVAADGTFESTGTPAISVKSTGIIVVYKPRAATTVQGTVAGTATITSTATGVPQVNATGTSALTITAAATGKPQVNAVGSAAVTLTGAATGKRQQNATATAPITITAALTGTRTLHGSGTAALTLTGAATGGRVRHGSGTATLTVTGAGFGTIPPPVTVLYGQLHGPPSSLVGRLEGT